MRSNRRPFCPGSREIGLWAASCPTMAPFHAICSETQQRLSSLGPQHLEWPIRGRGGPSNVLQRLNSSRCYRQTHKNHRPRPRPGTNNNCPTVSEWKLFDTERAPELKAPCV